MDGFWHSVLFIDLDKTIISGPFKSAVFPMVRAELAKLTGLEERKIHRLIADENRNRQKNPDCPATLAMDWDDIVNSVANNLGVNLSSNVLDIVRSYAGPSYSFVLDSAEEVIKQLAAPHRAIVAATKGLRKYQIPILDALHLTHLFTDILTPDVHNVLKSDIAFYGEWPHIARIQISVGDCYEDDVFAPRQFGFRTVWKLIDKNGALESESPFVRPLLFAYREDQFIRPDAIVFSLQELPDIVRQLEQVTSSL